MCGEKAIASIASCFDISDSKNLPFLLAHRISTNRVVAGVHFPIDCRAGAYIGLILGDLIYNLGADRSGDAGGPRSISDQDGGALSFEGTGESDFLLSNFSEIGQTKEKGGIQPLAIARHLWAGAAAEWKF